MCAVSFRVQSSLHIFKDDLKSQWCCGLIVGFSHSVFSENRASLRWPLGGGSSGRKWAGAGLE